MPATMIPKTTSITMMMMTAITQRLLSLAALSAPSVRHAGEQTCACDCTGAARLLYPARTMNRRIRDIVILAVGLALVLGAALGGYAVVRARAQGSPARARCSRRSSCRRRPPTATPPAPQYERWTVGIARAPDHGRRRPANRTPRS